MSANPVYPEQDGKPLTQLDQTMPIIVSVRSALQLAIQVSAKTHGFGNTLRRTHVELTPA
jgi:hypothetical protein